MKDTFRNQENLIFLSFGVFKTNSTTGMDSALWFANIKFK